MFLTCASMARSYDSTATPCTASSSWARVNTGPGAPVDARQGEIGADQVGTAARERAQRCLAVGGDGDLEPGPLQVVAHQPDDRRFVVDDENGFHARSIVGGRWGGD